jgi:hypothetical protein
MLPLALAAAMPGTDPLPNGLGTNIHFTDPKPGEMKMIAEGGFRWLRMDFAWQGTERKKGEYDFSAYDRLLAAGQPHGLRFLFILDYSNPLYEADRSVQTEEGRAAMARWAAAAVEHFKGRGILWEMWNEPNIGVFWKPKPDAAQYVALARAVGEALRKAAPQEMYCGPATSTIPLDYLEACFKAGLLDYWCAVTVHPYRQSPPETAEADYRRLRGLIDKYAPKGKRIPIISGEWGYSAAWRNYDEDRQGKYLPRQWLINLANDVPLSIWYDWHDDGKDPKEPEHHFGTVANELFRDRDPPYDPKPAYRAAKTLTGALAGFRFSKRLAVGGPDDYVLLFARGDEVRLAAWTTAREPRRVVVPAGPGKFRATGHLGEALPDLQADAAGLAVTLTDAPQYLAPEKLNDLLRAQNSRGKPPTD